MRGRDSKINDRDQCSIKQIRKNIYTQQRLKQNVWHNAPQPQSIMAKHNVRDQNYISGWRISHNNDVSSVDNVNIAGVP